MNRRRAPAPAGRSPESADLILLVTISLWAANYSIVKFGISEFNPIAFPLLRFGVGGLAMVAIVRARGGTLRVARSDLPLLIGASFLGVTLTQVCLVYSLSNTSASDVSLLAATEPMMTALLATAVGLERLGPRHWVSVAIGLIGVVLIVDGGANGDLGGSSLAGAGLALGAAFFSSASALPIRPLLRRYSAWRILTFEMVAGSLLLVPLGLPSLAGQDLTRVSVAGWGALGYAVVLTGLVTNLLYFTAIGRVGPSRAAVFGYLQSFLGVLFAVALLGERVAPLQIAGGLVVIGSVVLSRPHLRWRDARTPGA